MHGFPSKTIFQFISRAALITLLPVTLFMLGCNAGVRDRTPAATANNLAFAISKVTDLSGIPGEIKSVTITTEGDVPPLATGVQPITIGGQVSVMIGQREIQAPFYGLLTGPRTQLDIITQLIQMSYVCTDNCHLLRKF